MLVGAGVANTVTVTFSVLVIVTVGELAENTGEMNIPTNARRRLDCLMLDVGKCGGKIEIYWRRRFSIPMKKETGNKRVDERWIFGEGRFLGHGFIYSLFVASTSSAGLSPLSI